VQHSLFFAFHFWIKNLCPENRRFSFRIIIHTYTIVVLGLGTFGYFSLMGDYDEKIIKLPK
jgi:hypothetical protein